MASRPATSEVEPALLNGEQAARYMSVSVSVIKELSRDGLLPFVVLRHGTRRNLRRWSRASLDRVIAQREQGGQMSRRVARARTENKRTARRRGRAR